MTLILGKDLHQKFYFTKSPYNVNNLYRGHEQAVEETKPRSAPVFVSHPEAVTVEEGEWARFCCRVTGHPKPRVMWLINGNTIVNVSTSVSLIKYIS